MPQMNTVVLTDAAAADHSFQPRGIDSNGVATLVKSTGVPIGDERLTISRTRTSQGREKAVFKMTIPVVQNATEGGITKPAIVRTAYAELTFSFDGGSSTAERANVRAMVADLVGVGQTLSVSVIDDLDALF